MIAKVYGIPNCSSVKKAIASLKENGTEVLFHDFKKQGVPADLLDHWINVFGLDILINRKGTTWRGLDSAQQQQALLLGSAKALLQQNPSLIKRPIVDLQGSLVIGQTEFNKGNP
ncbi:MAG TPA: ArsC/Spx/MgsR family protein [Limnobacter sp.]|nr:ArsC/Spx/MgsR family protein [Limnobacter sp.]